MFSIEILSKKVPKSFCGSERNKRGYGIIQIGNFKENIYPLLSYWKIENYKTQWIEAIRRILARKVSRAALIVDMPQPLYEDNSALVWWPLYRVNKKIYIQEHLKDLRRFKNKRPFDSYNIYNYIHARNIDSDEGRHISEWTISLKDLQLFLDKITS